MEAENNKDLIFLSSYIEKNGYDYDLVNITCILIILYIIGTLMIKVKNSYL